MTTQTLNRRNHPLAKASEQLCVLNRQAPWPEFDERLNTLGQSPLRARGIEVLQVNVGKLCNQTCRHCHVDAGPDRREAMSREVADACLDVLRRAQIPILDITGGAPEMNPHFCHLVSAASDLGVHVIDRCNLTILTAPGYEEMADFLAACEVEIVASLPCYLESNVDQQRGDFVFRRSIQALRRLNELGYGLADSPRTLTLVYNPLGPSLPPNQQALETEYRRELRARYEVEFTRLYTITNMPISRFLDDLLTTGQYNAYMERLLAAFNPVTIDGLMCRTMLSVDWEGYLFDCDFNQMLGMQLAQSMPRHVSQLDDGQLERLSNRIIATGMHCYGCTAGAGSSCQGSVAIE